MKILGRKKQNRFLELLIKQAEFTVEGMQALLSYVKEPNEGLSQKVTQIEKDADEVRRILIDELNRTFVTPFDREDIFALSLTIDDVLDYANTTVEEMYMLDIVPNTFIERMVSLLTDAAREIYAGVLRLEDHPNVANDHAVRAKALENRVETVYREAIADLFQAPHDIDHVVDALDVVALGDEAGPDGQCQALGHGAGQRECVVGRIPLGHEHAEHPLGPECFDAKRRGRAAVDSAREAYHRALAPQLFDDLSTDGVGDLPGGRFGVEHQRTNIKTGWGIKLRHDCRSSNC